MPSFAPNLPQPTALATAPATPAARGATATPRDSEEGSFTFSDFLDVINPLQHIPVIGAIYREVTGDQIGFGAKNIGGLLFGGIPGLVASVVDSVIQNETGRDSGAHLIAFLRDGAADPDADIAAKPPAARPAAPEAVTQLDAGDDGDDEVPSQPIPQAARQLADLPAVPVAPVTTLAAPAANGTAAPNLATLAADTKRQAALYQARMNAQPQPLHRSVALAGVPGAGFAQLPSPQVLAANPGLIAAARGGAKTVTPGLPPGMPSGAWVQLMQAAPANQPGGPNALAASTFAKAISSYGGANPPLASLSAASKR